jgi:tetratricopeptide (TPR) repeat protein
MTVPDEIAKIEAEGIRRTQVGDWNGAREYFEQALAFDMPALRQAQILKNVAGTYIKERDRQAAVRTVERAIAVLDSANVSAEQLRNELHNLSTLSGGRMPLSTFWYAVVFLAGLYWGVSVASGAPMDPKLVYLGPPVLCLFTASVAVGGLNRRALLGAVTLYVNFLFSFGIGYAISAAGIVRFGYGPK